MPADLKRFLTGRPWALSQTALEDLKAFAGAGVELPQIDLTNVGTPTVATVGEVAVVEAAGVLVKRASILDALFGEVTTYDGFLAAVRDCLAASPAAVVLHFDSPGGAVSGCAECASALFELRQSSSVPLVAVGDGQVCSAAYWLASQCDRIAVTEATQVGSIGIVGVTIDETRAVTNNGFDVRVFRSSDRKATEYAYQDVQGRDLQSQVERYHQMFVESVARGRGKTVAEILPISDARVCIGNDAVAQGFADEVTTLNAVIAALQ